MAVHASCARGSGSFASQGLAIHPGHVMHAMHVMRMVHCPIIRKCQRLSRHPYQILQVHDCCSHADPQQGLHVARVVQQRLLRQ